MKNADIVIAHPSSPDELKALTSFMHSHHIPFQLASSDSPYDKNFVNMILQGDEDRKVGKGKKVSIADLNELWK